MNNAYTETSVKRKATIWDTLLKIAAWACVLVVFAAGLLFQFQLLLFVAFVLAVLAYMFLPYLSVVYEYVYCDGQIDFDKIMNGEKRKQVYRTDLDKAVLIAPANSHEMDGYKYNKTPERDFTSKVEGRRVYAIVENAGEQNTILYFEPDDRMLDMIKQKAPRKFKAD